MQERLGLSIDDTQHLFILHLVILPVLQAACDHLVRVRAHRRIQGTTGGVPLVRADAAPRPAALHRPLPAGTIEEWAQRYVADGFGHLSEAGASTRVEDKLSSFLEGEIRTQLAQWCSANACD
jgi:hypothetical protein